MFFSRYGLDVGNWQQLAEALVRHASNFEVGKVEDSQFGKRYVVDGIMRMADGREALVRTVWFIDTGSDVPRFVTAYPLRRNVDD